MMNAPKWAFALAALSLASPGLSQVTVERGQLAQTGPIVIQMDGIGTGSLVTMLLRDVMRVPYVIAPDVLADRRPTSVNLVIPRNQVPERVVAYLRRVGFNVQLDGGTVYVSRAGGRYGASSVPSGSPVDLGRSDMPLAASVGPFQGPGQSYQPAPPVPVPAAHLLAYLPAHRSPAFLASVIAPLLGDVKFGARDDVKAAPAEQSIAAQAGPDVLVMSGSEEDLARARRLVGVLDRPRPMVAVKAVILEVSNVQARGSALSVLAKLGDGRLSAGSYDGEVPASQFVRIATGALSAVLSAVREDSRFKVVASPNLAALSGAVARIDAGSQVPTLGAVTYSDGTPVRSVVYRDSGVILEVRPTVRGNLIELDVRQERSSFAKTTTGVEDSPTLNRTATLASVVLKSGESVVLAGLNETREGNTRKGLLAGLLGVRSRESTEAELLVVLQAELVPLPVSAGGQFIDLDPPSPEEAEDAPTDPLAPAPRRAIAAPGQLAG